MSERPVLYQFQSLQFASLLHAVSTRLGGHSSGPYTSLNLGHTVGDSLDAVAANHEVLYRRLGVSSDAMVTVQQIHGSKVAIASDGDAGTRLPGTDAMVSATPGLSMMMRYADCVPILLFDPVRNAVGLVHAGWRGTLARIAHRTVRAMTDRFGCLPHNVHAGIGPSIGPCCYQIGPEVVARVHATLGQGTDLLQQSEASGHAHLNLWIANRDQLSKAGVRQIEMARLCTACRTDLFYSHRAQGGRTGRFAAIIGLRGDGV